MIETNKWKKFHLNFLKRIQIGISKSPRKFFTALLVSYGATWGFVEAILGLVPDTENHITGIPWYILFLITSFIIAVILVSRPLKTSFNFLNNEIIIQFGDLFAQDGLQVIPVSQYMYEIEVIPSSLQGIVINKFRDSARGQEGLRKYHHELNSALRNKENVKAHRNVEREIDKKQFSLGTTAKINLLNQEYLMLALTETELQGQIPDNNCTGTKLWIALEYLWHEADISLGDKSINIPLLGSGISGIELSPNHLLDLNILALLNSIVEKGKITTGKIRIILHDKYLEEIDLTDIKQRWSQAY